MQSSPLQILSLLVLHSRCLFRVAVLDSWTPTVFSVSLHRNNQKNSNKTLRVGWEWTAQRQTNLSLLCICWPRHLLFFFSLTLYTDPHLSFSFFSSLTNTFFLHLSVTLNFLPSHSLGLWKGTAPHVLKDARKKKKHDSLRALSALTFRQLWARQPRGKTSCKALLKGQFHRTIAHMTS